MIDIAKKTPPRAVCNVLLYLSYCAMSWFIMRGNMAYYGERYNWAAWFANDVWAFFLGGIIPFLVYYLMSSVVFRTLQFRVGGNIHALAYGVNLTVFVANIVLFALKFMYIAIPVQAPIVNIFLDPIVTLLFVALYLWYAFRMEYVRKPLYHVVITQVFGTFLTVYGVFTLINLIVTAVG